MPAETTSEGGVASCALFPGWSRGGRTRRGRRAGLREIVQLHLQRVAQAGRRGGRQRGQCVRISGACVVAAPKFEQSVAAKFLTGRPIVRSEEHTFELQ